MMPPSVLIRTVARDTHALLVAAALRELGTPAHILSQSSLPGRGDFAVTDFGSDPVIVFGSSALRLSEIGGFWNRRTPRDFNFPAWAHPADQSHIETSFITALEGVGLILDEGFAVNPSRAARTATNKLLQLRSAPACGLVPPPTLVTSDLTQVAAFEAAHGPICIKPLAVYYWKSEDAVTATMTSVVRAEALDRDAVGLLPAIYQPYIPKAFEVRLLVFGHTFIATRIDVVAGSDTESDWRRDGSYLDRLSAIDIPDHVRTASLALLRTLGLRFGAFDFVVTPSGDWIFLEVNQAGQFAWQEIYDPETRVIEPFARYLAGGQDDFLWDPSQASDALAYEPLSRSVQTLPDYAALSSEPQPLDRSSHFDETSQPLPAG